MNESVITHQHGEILEIALNRPEVYNALNLDVMVMLSEALASVCMVKEINNGIIQ